MRPITVHHSEAHGLHFASLVLNTFFFQTLFGLGRCYHETTTFAVQVLGYDLLRFLFVDFSDYPGALDISYQAFAGHALLLLLVVFVLESGYLLSGVWRLYQVCKKGLLLRPWTACSHSHRGGSVAGGTTCRAVARDGRGDASMGVMFMMSTRSVSSVWHQDRDIGIGDKRCDGGKYHDTTVLLPSKLHHSVPVMGMRSMSLTRKRRRKPCSVFLKEKRMR